MRRPDGNAPTRNQRQQGIKREQRRHNDRFRPILLDGRFRLKRRGARRGFRQVGRSSSLRPCHKRLRRLGRKWRAEICLEGLVRNQRDLPCICWTQLRCVFPYAGLGSRRSDWLIGT